MFKQTLLAKARRNRILIDYAPSYDKRYRKRNRVTALSLLKWLSLCGLLALSALYVLPLQAANMSHYSTLDDVGSGQLLFESSETLKDSDKEKRLYQTALLLNSAAQFDINGILATVTVTQSFLNTGDTLANGLYTFPLPENSAVNYLKIQVGNREIEGRILEKGQALKVFNRAKASGKKASLVEQHRPNLFTNKIANIGANEQITVTLKYVQHVDYSNGLFSLRFPMSITPRYTPRHTARYTPRGTPEDALENTSESENSNLNISALTQYKTLTKNNIHLNVNLNAGMPLEKINSPSHTITLDTVTLDNATLNKQLNGEPVKISVGNVQVPMDKDFVIQWRPTPSDTPQLSLFNQTLAGEEYTLAMLLPPTVSEASKSKSLTSTFARDITFIIDTSGSMQGESIKQAKQSLRFALNTLSPQDSFNIIAFSSSSHNLFNETHMATPKNIGNALRFIAKLSANGGTEMYQPLANALSMPQTKKQHSETIKQILFITDGAVSNELSLFKLIKNTHNLPRLFTVGIGSAPNGFFMRKAAQFGQGSYTFIGNVNEVEEKMSHLLNKISNPALTNIKVQFHPLHVGNVEQYPKKIPDLYVNEPLVIAFKTSQKPSSIQLFGDLVSQGWQQEIDLLTPKSLEDRENTKQASNGITSIWARAKIEDLLDGLVTGRATDLVKTDVIKTSLKHQVMSPYTSFIAVEKELFEEDTLEDNKEQNEKAELKLKRKANQLANNTLQAAVFPKTAMGWKAQFLLGLVLLCLSFAYLLRFTYKDSRTSK